MSEQVKRYKSGFPDDWEDPNGEYVDYDDHIEARAADRAEIERLRAENERLKDDNDSFHSLLDALERRIAELESHQVNVKVNQADSLVNRLLRTLQIRWNAWLQSRQEHTSIRCVECVGHV